MEKKFDIVICGVGGQGILLCSDIIGTAGIIEGLEVKGSEIHGMSQRGGSVDAHIRLNCKFGPRIPDGEADLIIGLEPLETARNLFYLKSDGIVVTNSFKIPLVGKDYDEKEIIDFIKSKIKNTYVENFTQIAQKIGSIKVLNILMLGYASKFIPLKKESFYKAIEYNVKKEFLKVNLSAFNYFNK